MEMLNILMAFAALVLPFVLAWVNESHQKNHRNLKGNQGNE
jgi:hypothetical protein